MNDLDDPIIAALHKHINALAEMCNERIKPGEPELVWHAQNLFRELAQPYIDAMCEYVALRPKFAFTVAWCNSSEDLVPVGDTEDDLD